MIKKIKNLLSNKLAAMSLGLGVMAVAVMKLATAANAAPIDYSSSTQVITDATTNLGPSLFAGSLTVVGIALGVWLIFFLIGKLRKHTK